MSKRFVAVDDEKTISTLGRDKISKGERGWLYADACPGCGKIRYMQPSRFGMKCHSCGGKDKYDARFRHGFAWTRLSRIYQAMVTRCDPVKCTSQKMFDTYAGRGIRVCAEWLADRSAFFQWAMLNGYSPELSLDRSDNDKGYYPSNCKWATREEQGRNRRNNVLGVRSVEEIRSKMLDGACTGDLAVEYGVSTTVIAGIRSEKQWKGIGPSTKHLAHKVFKKRGPVKRPATTQGNCVLGTYA